MELYMDDKWKLAKKGSRNSASRREFASDADGGSGGAAFLKRSATMPAARARAVSGGGGPPSSFTSRCASLVKEQRARFYIMRRCVTMLICWRDYP